MWEQSPGTQSSSSTRHVATHIEHTHRKSKQQSESSYLKNQPGLRTSDPFKCSPGSHSQLVTCSVGIMSSCLLLVCPLSVSFSSVLPLLLSLLSGLHCLCYLVSQTRNSATLLIVLDYSQQLRIPVLKAAVKSTKVKSYGNNACVQVGVDTQINKQTNRCRNYKHQPGMCEAHT